MSKQSVFFAIWC